MSRWYRAYEGTVTDAKLGEIAMVAECSRSVAIAAWHAVMESAACVNDGGRFDTTPRRVAVVLCEPIAVIERVFAEMTSLGMIDGQLIGAWKRRQYESDSSTERSRKHRNAKRNGDATLQGRDATPPETETETELPPRAPRKRRGEGKHLIPDDWVLPPVAELTPSAKACAEQWTQASYDAVGEGFRLYWRTERKMKTDWRETWCNWVLREHSKVMRDQKFGNDPKPANGHGKRAFETPAEWNAYCDEMAAMYRGPGNGLASPAEIQRRAALALDWESRRKPIDDPPPRRTAATGAPRSIAELIPKQLAQASH